MEAADSEYLTHEFSAYATEISISMYENTLRGVRNCAILQECKMQRQEVCRLSC